MKQILIFESGFILSSESAFKLDKFKILMHVKDLVKFYLKCQFMSDPIYIYIYISPFADKDDVQKDIKPVEINIQKDEPERMDTSDSATDNVKSEPDVKPAVKEETDSAISDNAKQEPTSCISDKKDNEDGDSVVKLEASDSKDIKVEPMDVDKVDKDEHIDVEVEHVSPKKTMKMLRVSQGNISKANLKAYSLLTKKCDVDLIDVSKSIQEHTYYPKVTKPYSKLDNLLERRTKLEEMERKQRDGIEQQIQWKLRLEAAKEEKQDVTESPEKKIISLPVSDTPIDTPTKKLKPVKYCCYSALCRAGDVPSGQCYSISCRQDAELEEEEDDIDADDTADVQMEVDEDTDDKTDPEIKQEGDKSDNDKSELVKNDSANKSAMEGEDVDILGDKEEGKSKNNSSIDTPDSDVTNESNANKPKVVHVPVNKDLLNKSETNPKQNSAVGKSTSFTSPSGKKTTTISIPGNLAQLIAQKTGQTLTYSQAQQFIKQALEKMSVEDLRAKIPHVRHSQDKITLMKVTKTGVKKKGAKKTSLPPPHKFKCNSGKSLFILEKWESRRLARKSGKVEVSGFKYDCKMSNVSWPYPCPRPLFKTAFKYRIQTIKSLAGAALHLRILWACIRWDDMATKSPAGGTNTVSTETEITTTELLKRRDIGPHGLRSEFLVRKIVVPLGVPQQPKGLFYQYSLNFLPGDKILDRL